MLICTTCRREIKVGERATQNFVIVEVPSVKNGEARSNETRYQHANCYEIEDGPLFDEEGNEIGYYKARVYGDLEAEDDPQTKREETE